MILQTAIKPRFFFQRKHRKKAKIKANPRGFEELNWIPEGSPRVGRQAANFFLIYT